MKRSLTKVLLALSLVMNPVAVITSDFHDVEMKADQTTQKAPHHPTEQQETFSEPAPHDSTNCEMPCCEDSECSKQGICFFQNNSDVVTQKALRFSPQTAIRGWGASITMVPDRELPPDIPPPIHI